MELRQLAAFLAVAEEGSFTRAADRLHLVQSAVSASVRTLERELGGRLFVRTTRHVELSDTGRALLPEARRVLVAVELARDAVAQVRGGLRGTVVLGTMQAQGMRAISLPALLATFGAEHPGVEVILRHVGGSLEMAEQVRDGRLDLAFVSLTVRRSAGLTLTRLASEPIVFACPPGHRLAGRADVELAALAGETFVELPDGWGTRMAADRAFAAAGVSRRVTLEVNDTATAVEFIRHGLAVSLIPPSMASDVQGISFVPIRHHAPVFHTFLATSADREQTAAKRALIDAVLGLARVNVAR